MVHPPGKGRFPEELDVSNHRIVDHWVILEIQKAIRLVGLMAYPLEQTALR